MRLDLEEVVMLPDGTIDFEANQEARKEYLQATSNVPLEIRTGARCSDHGYPTEMSSEATVEAFKRDFAPLDPQEQPNIEGRNLEFCSTHNVGEGTKYEYKGRGYPASWDNESSHNDYTPSGRRKTP